MTAAANQWGYWQTGNWCDDGQFRGPAQQAGISIDISQGRNGYGYANRVPGTWSRSTALKGDLATDLNIPANYGAIVNHVNTAVGHVGSGIYYVVKQSGGSPAFDADAVSTATLDASGGKLEVIVDFLDTVGSGMTFAAGLNHNDPTLGSSYIGPCTIFCDSVNFYLFDFSGGQVGSGHSITGKPYAKLVYDPVADTMSLYTSADRLSWGAALESFVAGAGTTLFYFDSSLSTMGARFNVTFAKVTTNAYTMAAASGAFALTGSAAALKVGYRLAASSGAFTLAGTAVTLRISMPAASGAFVLTGSAVALKAGRLLSAAKGTFTLSGSAVSLLKQARLTAASGAFVLNGSAVNLRHGYLLTAGSGAFALTGRALGFSHGFKLAALAGAFALNGSAVALKAARRLAAAKGTFVLTGSNVALHKGFTMAAAKGVFTFSGSAIIMRLQRRYEPGRFSFYGRPVTLRIVKTWFVPDNAPAGVAIAAAPPPAMPVFVTEAAPPAVQLEA